MITAWSAVLLEKLTGPQLVKKFPAFYGNRMFITAFTRARHVPILNQINAVHVSIPRLEDTFQYYNLLSYLIPSSRVLLKKLTGSQLFKKFPAFYGNRRLITAFTTAHVPILNQINAVHVSIPRLE